MHLHVRVECRTLNPPTGSVWVTIGRPKETRLAYIRRQWLEGREEEKERVNVSQEITARIPHPDSTSDMRGTAHQSCQRFAEPTSGISTLIGNKTVLPLARSFVGAGDDILLLSILVAV